jgi:branched-chain amino acid transport system permease protein
MNIGAFKSKRFLVPAVLLLVLVLLVTAPLYISPKTMPLMISFLMYIVLAVSWAIFSGPTGYISLAPAAFFGSGVYVSALLFGRGGELLPLPVVIIIGGLASFCFAFIIGLATLRLRGIYFTMFSFGLLELARQIIQYYEFNVTGTRGRYIANVGTDTVYYLMLAVFLVLMVTAYFVRRSKWGLALKSIGQNEEAAAHSGVNVTLVKVFFFAISSVFMGAAGSIMATGWTYIDPSIAFNLNYSFMPVLMAIVGGTGVLYGPVLGAVGLTYLRQFLLVEAANYYMLIFGAILVLAILYMPNGLVGVIQKLIGWIRKGRKGGVEVQNANT